jgi:hypothetical protein
MELLEVQGETEIGPILQLKTENRNLKLDPRSFATVQFEFFGFESQDSSDFHFLAASDTGAVFG